MLKRRVKVFVDAEVLVAPHFSGIGHYTLNLLKALDDLLDNRDDIQVTLGVWFRRKSHIQECGFRNFKIRKSPFSLRISNELKARGKQPYYDLFFGKQVYFFPNYTTWPLLHSKMVSVIYDLSFEKHKQFVEPRNQAFLSEQVKKTVERSNSIVTISKSSQEEICNFYRVGKKNVPILYPAVDQSLFYRRPKDEINSVKARLGIYGKYILFVGNLEPRKNLKNLLLAYEKLDSNIKKEHTLLLVGAKGWLDNEIFEQIEKLRIAGNHIQQPLEYVEDKDLPALYSGASVFVYPSLYEGFGIPPLEAMACGTPVVVSDNSSLPEAVGGAALQVNASDIQAISSSIEELLNNEKLKTELVVKGYKQVDSFSWKQSAEKLLSVFEELS